MAQFAKIFSRKIFWVVSAVIIIALIIYWRSLGNGIEVKAYEIKKKALVISVTGTSTGTVKADNEFKLSAQRIGRITRLYVEEGSRVKASDPIADLESDEMQQRLQLAAASHERLKAQLDALKSGLISFKTEVDANMKKARAVLDEAESRMRRFRELKDKGYLSESDLEAVRREYDVANASYSASLASKDQIRAKEDEIRAQASAIEQAKREYNLAKIMLDYSFIKSPITGVVTSRPVKLAETLPLGGLIASVVATDSLYIEAFIDEADAAKVSVGQQVNVTMDAYPEAVFRGEVYMLSPVVLGNKQEARTFEARVRLADKKIMIKPGMSADVEVIISKKENVLIVPSQAIIEKNEARYLYVVTAGRALLRQIKTGQFNWNFTEVSDGIGEGDVVITNPDTAGLKDRARVKVSAVQK